VIQDGIGADRREARLPRVGHGLRRLVVIGSDGMVSLPALRWLSGQNAALVMLDIIGKVLVTAGPVRASDARLRRAQALAEATGASLQLCRELISAKLLGQESIASAQMPRALSQLAEKQRSHRSAEIAWKSTDKPRWLDERAYEEGVLPRLINVPTSTIALELGVSLPYASDLRSGRKQPHLRHWLTLARLVGSTAHGS